MSRPATRSISLKDGFYIEISSKTGGSAIKIRRDTEEEAMKLFKQYSKTKTAKFLGEAINGKIKKEK